MKFTSTLIGAASGSIAGLTFSRNRGGQYMRRRAIPTNPATERQGIARENLASAVAAWTNNLTPAQRQSWATYAQATPRTDSLGEQVILSGQQMFVRTASIRYMAALAQILQGPEMPGLGNTPQYLADPVVDASTQKITFDAVVEGDTIDDNLGVYMSRPVPVSRTAAHEPRRFAARVQRNNVDDIYEVNVDTPFAVSEGQLVRVTMVLIWGDGRVSAECSRDIVVAA